MSSWKQLIIAMLFSVFFFTIQSSANVCETTDIILGEHNTGTWDDTCDSINRQGSYARFYSFTLDEEKEIIIHLNSTSDTYLILLDSNQSGEIIYTNDDGGEGLNSKIIATLGTGTYIIEATTYGSNISNDFNLLVESLIEVSGYVSLGLQDKQTQNKLKYYL